MIKPHPCAESLESFRRGCSFVKWVSSGLLLLHHFRDSYLVLMPLNYIIVDKKERKVRQFVKLCATEVKLMVYIQNVEYGMWLL